MNHQNITSVSNGAYSITTSGAINSLNYVSTFGTYNNSNSNTIYSSRQLQLAARLHFNPNDFSKRRVVFGHPLFVPPMLYRLVV